ncbi:MAG: B12-binding domain-containing radical SAM protein, partial [Candidatus Cloacimonetes bacterium]|nr:B12-binding domain-containing radical SAM protein [Candidatus Cloacimonadota bacterium]
DMAHLLLQPTRMSKSRFYYHILRTYYKTSVSLRAHRYILKKYGLKVYLRTLKGALHITLQYLKLILAGEG